MYARQRLPALFAVMLIAACGTTADPTGDAPELRSVKPGGGGSTASGYGVVELFMGTEYAVRAHGVNDDGLVVGAAEQNAPNAYVSRAWLKTSTSATMSFLPWAGGTTPVMPSAWASAVSNANASGLAFVIGTTPDASGNTTGARWTLQADGTVDLPQLLPFEPAGVNAAGTVVGQIGTTPADRVMKVLRLNGDELTITTPFATPVDGPFGLVDLNESEDLLYDEDVAAGRSRVRVAGTWVRLDPPAGMGGYQTWGTAVSDRITLGSDQVVFVSGKLQLGPTECYPMRWTVNVTTGAVVNVERRTESGTAIAVNSNGDVTGTYGARWSVNPFVWTRTGSFAKLPTPKGLRDGKGVAFSPDGRYIAGYGEKSLQLRGLLWTRL